MVPARGKQRVRVRAGQADTAPAAVLELERLAVLISGVGRVTPAVLAP